MTWTVTIEDYERTYDPPQAASGLSTVVATVKERAIPPRINVRAIIKIDEQAELKDLIASLQKHVKSDAG